MRISHNISAMNTYRQYNANAASANKSMEKLSSGSRINRAADDAAGLSISEKMRSQIRGLTQGTRNAQDGVSFIQTAEGALNEVSDMLTRLKELAVQVQNGTYSTDDKANIGAEMKALGTAMSEIYANTKFNGIAVFGTQTITAGELDVNDGTGTAAAIKYGENGSQTVTILAAETTNVAALSTATYAANTTPAGVTVTLVEDAITEVNTTRASYGAQQNQLEHASNNMATTKENLQAAESRVRDVDMAEEMMTYTKNNILLQAAQSMLAQANSQPQGVLQLLQ
ncbi:MAG: flagellin [Clostridiales bacterium GWF2_36_10]|nr:MAG: flagellin [Clostridiales bacterium GWF2_36_10]HAN20833.1 flagellin [Clostridiales bacterium]